jgi:hypothetical protein
MTLLSRWTARVGACGCGFVLLTSMIWLACATPRFPSASRSAAAARPCHILAQPTVGSRVYSVTIEQYDPASLAGPSVSLLGPSASTRALVFASIPVKPASRAYVLAVPFP